MDALEEEKYMDRQKKKSDMINSQMLLFASPKFWADMWIREDLSCFEGTGTWKDKNKRWKKIK